jgi:hypothetical protein
VIEMTVLAVLACLAGYIAWHLRRTPWVRMEGPRHVRRAARRARLHAAWRRAIERGEIVHVGASEAPAEEGAIGTIAARPSDDLLTFEQQVRGDADEWAWFEEAMVAYEDALLTRRVWRERDSEIGNVRVLESTQQRIDRWLSEGGDGIRQARSEARQAASETWDAPSGQLALVDRSDAERVAEAVLTA